MNNKQWRLLAEERPTDREPRERRQTQHLSREPASPASHSWFQLELERVEDLAAHPRRLRQRPCSLHPKLTRM